MNRALKMPLYSLEALTGWGCVRQNARLQYVAQSGLLDENRRNKEARKFAKYIAGGRFSESYHHVVPAMPIRLKAAKSGGRFSLATEYSPIRFAFHVCPRKILLTLEEVLISQSGDLSE